MRLQATLFFGIVTGWIFILVRMMAFGWWHHRPVQILFVLSVFFAGEYYWRASLGVVGMIQAGMGKYYTFPVVGWLICAILMPADAAVLSDHCLEKIFSVVSCVGFNAGMARFL